MSEPEANSPDAPSGGGPAEQTPTDVVRWEPAPPAPPAPFPPAAAGQYDSGSGVGYATSGGADAGAGYGGPGWAGPGYGGPGYGGPGYGGPGYGGPGYGGPAYGGPGWAGPGYGGPGYGGPGYGAPGWGGSGSGGPSRPRLSPLRRLAVVLATLALVAIPAFVGYRLGNQTSSSSSSSSLGTTAQQGGGGSSNGSGVALDEQAIAARVSKSVVNITSQLSTGGVAAGTGIIISSSGLVLTNNHVIADTSSLSVEIGGDGNSHPAKVLGYDVADDVALVQIENVSGLTPATTASSTTLSVGDPVVALGNAGGRGGAPTVVTGSVVALGQQITASDRDGSNAETLSNLIETDADIQPGDSGGPLADANARVVGMNAAASAANGGFGFRGVNETRGYAIPIESALAIAKKISSGTGGTNIHLGGNRALLGVAVQPDTVGRGSQGGAPVTGVQKGSGADKAGIVAGDTIIAIDGKPISSTTALTKAMTAYNPGDTVEVTWLDANGNTHHAAVKLGSGPPA